MKAESPGPGQGATFEIRLPLTYAARMLVRQPPPQVEAAPPRKIVIVEDNADSRELMSEILSEQGHRVDTAGDGVAFGERRDGVIDNVENRSCRCAYRLAITGAHHHRQLLPQPPRRRQVQLHQPSRRDALLRRPPTQ